MMERMAKIVDIASIIVFYAGCAAAVAIAIAIIVYAVKSVMRFVVDAKYALRVKYFVEDSRKRIIEYDKRIKAVEKIVDDLVLIAGKGDGDGTV